jgi:single-stranded-DNA-specific exonuclease
MRWQIINNKKNLSGKSNDGILNLLLENRNIKTKKEVEEFLDPKKPEDIKIEELGIKKEDIKKILKRLEDAKKKKEKIVIFGDYDCDGVCATAILWETMYKLGYDVMPFIPDRFKDGYGLKIKSFSNQKIIELNPKLIITVDNGIVANEAIKKAKKDGIDVVVVDHHTKGDKKLSTNYIMHSTKVCGSALSWFLSRALGVEGGLDLVTLGTIADQMPLVGVNRSIVKFGLPVLSKTKRVGLQRMFKDSKIDNVGVYEVGYIIAPRINAMGRLAEATDSLRFLCTKDTKKADGLNKILNETNTKRQKIVDDVLTKTLEKVSKDKIIVISGDYHEGVIGLASGKITEKFYRPSVVLSENNEISKASARSISGFNIIEAIKETKLILEGGGHPMAAGFSIETKKIEEFRQIINKISDEKLTDDVLERKLKIDLEIDFENITKKLIDDLKKFEPTGQENYSPVFVTKEALVEQVKPVGNEGKHLKLKLKKNNISFDAIWFGATTTLEVGDKIDVAYSVEENVWNNKTSIQLKVKDIKN